MSEKVKLMMRKVYPLSGISSLEMPENQINSVFHNKITGN